MSRLLALLVAAPLVAGCGDEKKSGTVYRETAGAAPAAGRAADGAAGQGGAAATPPAAPRKVIFTATLDLTVDNVEKTTAKLRTLVGQVGGYVAKADVGGTPGYRTGTLSARLPVKEFAASVEQFSTLGRVNRSASDSQDVTEEFIDVEARLKNYKAEEVALNKLLEASAVRLEDIFKIREQIARNRAEVERIEGRLKFLSNQTELSTLTLTLREEFAPGPPPPPPTFSNRLSATLYRSLANLQQFAEEVVLFVVAVGPWLPVLLLLGWLTFWLLRRLVRLSERWTRPRRPVLVAQPLPTELAAEVPAPPTAS